MIDKDGWPKVAISILNWNGWQDTLDCLESVRRLDYPNRLTAVVDDSSWNDLADRIKAWAEENFGTAHVLAQYSEETVLKGGDEQTEAALDRTPSPSSLVLIRNEGNLGFTGGNYVATHCALRRERLVDYVFLLNNDAKVHPDCLSHLVLVDRRTDSGIIGAVILDETGNYVMFTGGWPRYVSFSIHSCLGIFLLLRVALSIGGRPGSPAQEC